MDKQSRKERCQPKHTKRSRFFRIWSLAFLAALFAACSVNPVTGKRHLQFYGYEWENNIGSQMYAPLKQSQGGDYILDEELTAYVQQVGQRLADQAVRKDVLQYEFSVLNNSTPNAWALPGGKIVINRGLLTELNSEAELAAVLGHEVIHADAAHGARQQSTGTLAQIGAVVSQVVLASKVENQATREVAMIMPALGAQLLMQRYGRDAEREADQYGMRYLSQAGYDPQGAVELQKVFVELSKQRNQDWLTGLFASHPPSSERVRNNQETAAQLPVGGETGRERYQQKTAYLHKVKPAYEAYGKANAALREGDTTKAQNLLDGALAIEPREGLFLALQGDIHRQKNENSKALQAYRSAIEHQPHFFYGHLRKGQLNHLAGQINSAVNSLSQSLDLLPTAEAHYHLGMIEKDRGNRQQAIEHFTSAAPSSSESGRLARQQLARLELGSQPGKYVASRAVQDDKGTVWVQLVNQSDVDIRAIEIKYTWLSNSRQQRHGSKTLPRVLKAGQQDQVRLGVRFDPVPDLSQRIRVEIATARPAD